VQLWGVFGDLVIVRGNRFDGFVRGIYVRPLRGTSHVTAPEKSGTALPWVIQHNRVSGVTRVLELEPDDLQIEVDQPNFS
jgi:hypothetical protein